MKMMKTAIVAAALVAFAGSAQAAQINSFAELQGANSFVDFNDQDGLIINGSTFSASGLSFSANNQFTVGQYIADLGDNGIWGVGEKFLSFDNIGNMTLSVSLDNLASGIVFAYNLYDFGPNSSAALTASFYDASNNLLGSFSNVFPQTFGSDSYNQSVVIGWTSESANIAHFELTGDGVVVDNFAVAAVPEPQTYALMLAGLGLVAAFSRKRSKQ